MRVTSCPQRRPELDDGRGIPDDVLESGGREGRWGLTGMRERARKIHGRVEIWSRSDAGTEVQLRVPGAIAYDQAARRTWFQRIFGGRLGNRSR